jgi:hypothetical protein
MSPTPRMFLAIRTAIRYECLFMAVIGEPR